MDNSFQVILLSAFVLFGLIGVGLFAAGSFESDTEEVQVSFTVWGEWDQQTFNNLLESSSLADSETITISYQSIPAGQLEDRLVNALARGEGPDVLLTPHTKLLRFSDLLTTVGEDFYPSRQFRDTFVEGSEVFLFRDGVIGLPLAVDPLVMYWNRDILTEAGFVSPPEFWSEVPQYARRITETDSNGDIQIAGIGLGSAHNIMYVKEILSSLFQQAENSIVSSGTNGDYRTLLSENRASLESAVGLYTQYGNPSSDTYAWSNSFASDRQAFTAGNLGLFFAPASEITRIRAENPNLNFDVTTIPQLEDGLKRTNATVYGLSILQQAQNKAAILSALQQLTNPTTAAAVTDQTDFAPAHKEVISSGANNAYEQTFFDSAIISRGWLDPDPEATTQIFSEIISDVNSGRLSVRQAIQQANTSLRNLLDNVAE